MINVTRQEAPMSLNSPEIQQYIQDLALYLANPAGTTKPEKPDSYRNSDLLEVFDRDFFSKCYRSEEKLVL